MNGKGDFRTVVISVIMPGQRFLDNSELNHIISVSKLCLTTVKLGEAPEPRTIGEWHALIRICLSLGKESLLVAATYVYGLSVSWCWSFYARNVSVRYPGLVLRVAQREQIL